MAEESLSGSDQRQRTYESTDRRGPFCHCNPGGPTSILGSPVLSKNPHRMGRLVHSARMDRINTFHGHSPSHDPPRNGQGYLDH